MNKRHKQYNLDCYVRNDFLGILSGALPLKYSKETARTKEEFSLLYTGLDSYDILVRYIYCPLPLIYEFYVVDWKNSFDDNRSFLHLDYWDEKWKLKKSVIKRRKSTSQKKKRIVSECIITKDQIFPEIVKYFQDVDPDVAKQILRNYNLQIII